MRVFSPPVLLVLFHLLFIPLLCCPWDSSCAATECMLVVVIRSSRARRVTADLSACNRPRGQPTVGAHTESCAEQCGRHGCGELSAAGTLHIALILQPASPSWAAHASLPCLEAPNPFSTLPWTDASIPPTFPSSSLQCASITSCTSYGWL